MKDWPPVFTFCLPFVGWSAAQFDSLMGLLQETERPLKWLLIGLCVGLLVDMTVALWDWLSTKRRI